MKTFFTADNRLVGLGAALRLNYVNFVKFDADLQQEPGFPLKNICPWECSEVVVGFSEHPLSAFAQKFVALDIL